MMLQMKSESILIMTVEICWFALRLLNRKTAKVLSDLLSSRFTALLVEERLS